ncbi:MAG: hypothetical protein P1V97_15245 [Planctomycetota bacterium]|nr:hypothetical protein [Planctomycetota bacterium]
MDLFQFSDVLLARLQGESSPEQRESLSIPISQLTVLRQRLEQSGQGLSRARQGQQLSAQTLQTAEEELRRLQQEYQRCFKTLETLQAAISEQEDTISKLTLSGRESFRGDILAGSEQSRRQREFLLHLFSLVQFEQRALKLSGRDDSSTGFPLELSTALENHGLEIETTPPFDEILLGRRAGAELISVQCQRAYHSTIPKGSIIQVLRWALLDKETGFRLPACPLELQISRGPKDALLASLSQLNLEIISKPLKRGHEDLLTLLREQLDQDETVSTPLLVKSAAFLDRCFMENPRAEHDGSFQGVLGVLEDMGLEYWPRSRRVLTEHDYRQLTEAGVSKETLKGVADGALSLGALIELRERAIVKEGRILGALGPLRFSLGQPKAWRVGLEEALARWTPADGPGQIFASGLQEFLHPFYGGSGDDALRGIVSSCANDGESVLFLESYLKSQGVALVPGSEPCIDRYPAQIQESVTPYYSAMSLESGEGEEGQIESIQRRGLFRDDQWMVEPQFQVIRTGDLEVLTAFAALEALSPGLDLSRVKEKGLDFAKDEDPRKLFDVLVNSLNEIVKDAPALSVHPRFRKVEDAFSCLKPPLTLKPTAARSGELLGALAEDIESFYAYSSSEPEKTLISVLSFSHPRSLQKASVLLSKGFGPAIIQELRKLCQRLSVLDGVPSSFENELLILIERDMCSEDKSRVSRGFIAVWKRIRELTVALDQSEARRGVNAAMSDFTFAPESHGFFTEHGLAPYNPPAGFPIGHEAVSGTIEITGAVPSGSRVVIKDIVFPGLSQGTVTLVTAVVSARQG